MFRPHFHSETTIPAWILLSLALSLFLSTPVFATAKSTAAPSLQVILSEGVVMPLRVDGIIEDSLQVLITKPYETDPILQAEPILRATAHVAPELRQQITSEVKNGGVALSALNQGGLQAMYDDAQVEIHLKIPFYLKESKAIQIQDISKIGEGEAPEDFSAQIGFYTSKTIDEFFRANIDGAFNMSGTVLESQSHYIEGAEHPFVRDESRLVYDHLGASTRYSLGDLRYTTAHYQSFQAMGGVSVTSYDWLVPGAAAFPSGRDEIMLPTPATVDVLLNGVLIRQLRLPSGRFDLRQIPINQGLNDLEIRILDEFGRTRIIKYPFVADAEHLQPGQSRFTYNLGVRSKSHGADRTYFKDQPLASVFHRRGLTQFLTLGYQLQGHSDHIVGGADGVLVGSLGFLAIDGAWSRIQNRDLSGGAARVRYRPLQNVPGPFAPLVIQTSVEHRSRNFALIDVVDPFNPYSTMVDVSLSSTLPQMFRVNLSGGYQFPRDNHLEGYYGLLGLGWTLWQNWRWEVSLSRRSWMEIRNDDQFLISLAWLASESNSQFTTSHETVTRESRADFQTSHHRHQLAGSLGHGADSATAEASYSHLGHRGIFNARQSWLSTNNNDFQRMQDRTELQYSTALVYAGGKVGLSQPISDSFAIFSRSRDLEGETIPLNPGSQPPAAEIDSLGPGVLSTLNSYVTQSILVDTSHFPDGTILERDSFRLLPTYRSGYHFKLKLKSNVIATGTLVDANGHPVALTAGTVEFLGEPNPSASPPLEPGEEKLDFFTNRDGRFVIEGLKPGRWRVKLNVDEAFIEFVIDSGSRGEIDLGQLNAEKQSQ